MFRRSSVSALYRGALCSLSLIIVAACSADRVTGPVTPVRVASVQVTPPAAELLAGASTPLSALVRDAAGRRLDGRTVSWQSSAPAVARVGEDGVVTGVAPGSAVIAATVEGVQATAAIVVQPVPVARVSLLEPPASVILRKTVTLRAIARDSLGRELTGRPISWRTSDVSRALVNAQGVVTGVALGTVVISAVIEGRTASAILEVVPPPVATVSLTSPSATLFVGRTMPVTATARDVDGITLTGRAVTYSSTVPVVATVSADGVITAQAPGSTLIVAGIEGASASLPITVFVVPVSTVLVSMPSASMVLGTQQQISAAARDADGSPLTGRAVTWSSTSPSVATVSPTGVITAISPGTTSIVATVEGVQGSATLTVTPVPVSTVIVTPTTGSLFVGRTLAFSAAARDASGNPLTGRAVSWSSSATTVATISATGVATAVAPGTTSITATVEGVRATTTLTVSLAPVASITVTPTSASLIVGGTRSLVTTLLDADGNTLTGRTITHVSSAPAVATVNAAGLVTAIADGSATITVSAEGQSVTVPVTVSPVPVADIVVTLASNALQPGQTAQGSAIVRDANGAALTGRTVAWSSSNAAVATVSGSGLVTAVAQGSATISASSGGVTGNAALTVTQVPVSYVDLTPASATLAEGSTQQLTATPRAAGGGALTGRAITWTTSSATVASVSSSGLVSAVGPGLVTITATSEGQSATATLVVVERQTLVAGDWHTCALATAGGAYCWGDNSDGRLGIGTNVASTSVPSLVQNSAAFVSLSTQGGHTCALTSGGAAWCWGDNQYGQLGDGTNTDRLAPVAVSGGLSFVSIRTGGEFSCALTANGLAYCWGRSVNFSLGNGLNINRSAPFPVSGGLTFTQLAVGAAHACGLVSGGQAYCWGTNGQGRLGDGTTTARSTPTLVTGGLSFIALHAGGDLTCGRTADRRLYCWGANSDGMFGDGTTTDALAPSPAAGGLALDRVSIFGNHTCALASGNAPLCWGANGSGQLGDGSTTARLIPTSVSGSFVFTHIASGHLHGCGRTAAGALYCWGANGSGQLGMLGTGANVPTQVMGFNVAASRRR